MDVTGARSHYEAAFSSARSDHLDKTMTAPSSARNTGRSTARSFDNESPAETQRSSLSRQRGDGTPPGDMSSGRYKCTYSRMQYNCFCKELFHRYVFLGIQQFSDNYDVTHPQLFINFCFTKNKIGVYTSPFGTDFGRPGRYFWCRCHSLLS